jgi:hypothetical protein
MKKSLCLSSKIYFTLGFLLLGFIGTTFMKVPTPEVLKFGGFICIKNVKTNKYVTSYEKEVTTLVGKKEQTQNAAFQILLAKDTYETGEVAVGDAIYLRLIAFKNERNQDYFIGDAGKSEHLIYGMSRTLLGLVPLGTAFKFEIMSATKKKGEAILPGDKLTLKVVSSRILEKGSTDKYFRFNVDVSTFKGGPEIFISDDSKLMTKLAQKWTKELTFEKTAWKGAAKPTEKKGTLVIGKKETQRATQKTALAQFNQTACRICSKNLNVGDEIAVLDCGHIFHKECVVDDWFGHQIGEKKCPTCTAVVKKYKIYKVAQTGSGKIFVENESKKTYEELGEELVKAILEGNSDEITRLLEEQPNLIKYKSKFGITPLHWAADFNKIKIFELLVKRGADLNAKNKYNQTPYDCAMVVVREIDDPDLKKTSEIFWEKFNPKVEKKAPTQEATQKAVLGKFNQIDCPICTEEWVFGDVIAELGCGHIFHKKCIDGWFNKGNNTCPNCRAVGKTYKLYDVLMDRLKLKLVTKVWVEEEEPKS